MKQFHHKLYIIYPFLLLVMIAILIFNIFSKTSASGVSTVPCIEPNKPLLQNYSFNLQIMVLGKSIPVDAKIGHDPASCLREIYTQDSSGLVYVHSVSAKNYTLADFLTVFNRLNNYHLTQVKVDGDVVDQTNSTSLAGSKTVELDYE